MKLPYNFKRISNTKGGLLSAQCSVFNQLGFNLNLWSRSLVLFGPEKYDVIYKKIRYPISQKSDIRYVMSHNFARIIFRKMFISITQKKNDKSFIDSMIMLRFGDTKVVKLL